MILKWFRSGYESSCTRVWALRRMDTPSSETQTVALLMRTNLKGGLKSFEAVLDPETSPRNHWIGHSDQYTIEMARNATEVIVRLHGTDLRS